jgi:hypothetical protein
MNLRQRFEIFKRDNWTCQYCGRRAPAVEIQVEHVRPVSKGGSHDMWNLVTACRECNAGKSAIPLTSEQIHRIDGHIPNVVAQIMAFAEFDNVRDRVIDLSRGGRLVGDWTRDMDALLDELSAGYWDSINSLETGE